MILGEKIVGETPLQFLDRMRAEHLEIADEKVSYAGRLDPMASGAMIVLVGNEVYDKEKYLACDKEYVAEFLIGVSTDTGDVLGMITEHDDGSFSDNEAKNVLQKIASLTEQTYPWFSGKTVDGIKLFDHFKAGNTNIERPKLSVTIREAEFLGLRTASSLEIKKYITDSIQKVSGDFRQDEILAEWKRYFTDCTKTLHILQARFVVSSGTFIRGFTELFPVPAVLYSLCRTRIFLDTTKEGSNS